MGVAGGNDRDACREIEEGVAVDVCDPTPLAPLHHEGIRAGEAWRHGLGVPGDQLRRLWAWQRGLHLGSTRSLHLAVRAVFRFIPPKVSDRVHTTPCSCSN